MNTPNQYPDINLNATDVIRWDEIVRSSIKPAPWLTGNLVKSGILPDEFSDAAVAPIVVGKAIATTNKGKQSETSIFLKASVDPEYLLKPPVSEYFPHENLKKHVRDELDKRTKHLRRPEFLMYPGYIFPNIANGTVYLDDKMSDPDCTPEGLRQIAGFFAKAYSLGGVCVGTRVLASNSYTHKPIGPLPSIIRESLKPARNGKIEPSVRGFTKGAATIFEMMEYNR